MCNANHFIPKSTYLGVRLLCRLHGAVCMANEPTETDEPSHVTVEKAETGYQLIHNDAPYYVKGAGAKMFLEELKEAGANSIRTWDAGYIKPLLERLKNGGWNGPYIITEFGPVGPWEVKKTNWGAELEQTSTDKGKFFFTSYMKGIYNRPDCLGSYVFFWGHKMETTPTWFSMILRGGEKTSPCDYMQAIWSKKWPTNRCPTTEPIQSRAAGQVIRKGGQGNVATANTPFYAR